MSDRDPTRWEYRTLEPPTESTMREATDPAEVLNQLGADRWELTGTLTYDGGGTKLLVLKRPVLDE